MQQQIAKTERIKSGNEKAARPPASEASLRHAAGTLGRTPKRRGSSAFSSFPPSVCFYIFPLFNTELA